MKLEEVLFGLVGAGGCWEIRLTTNSGHGRICIKSGNIVSAKFEEGQKSYLNAQALRRIIRLKQKIRTIDLHSHPECTESASFKLDFYGLMSFFESEQLDTTEQGIDRQSFRDIIDTCRKVFSEGGIDAIFMLDQDGIYKIEGNIREVSFETLYPEIMKLYYRLFKNLGEICQDDFIDIVANLNEKFSYFIANLRNFTSIVLFLKQFERANFELDQDILRKTFERVLKNIKGGQDAGDTF